MPQELVIIGCGPGGADYLLPLACKATVDLAVLAGSARLFELFPEYCGPRIIFDGRDVPRFLTELSGCQGRVGVLVTGDPSLYSLTKSIRTFFADIPCRIIPGISSVDVALARLGFPRHSARIISAHAPDAPELPALFAELREGGVERFCSDYESLVVLAGNPMIDSIVIELAAIFETRFNTTASQNQSACTMTGNCFQDDGQSTVLSANFYVLRDLSLAGESVVRTDFAHLSKLLGSGRVIVVISFHPSNCLLPAVEIL